jgi:hypothetical protein
MLADIDVTGHRLLGFKVAHLAGWVPVRQMASVHATSLRKPLSANLFRTDKRLNVQSREYFSDMSVLTVS